MLTALAARAGLRALPPHGRRLGAEVDFRTACALLELNEALVAGDAGARARARALHDAWAAAPLARAIPFANDALTLQAAELAQAVADVDAGDGGAPAVGGAGAARAAALRARGEASAAFHATPGPSSHLAPRPTLAFAVREAAAEAAADAAAAARRALAARVGFALWRGPSQAPVAGAPAGLWLKGRAAPGALVALYAGAVYSAEMLQRADDAGHLGNPRVARPLVPRFDEAVIDAGARVAGGERNPFALAAHARHPPAGVAPNVMRIQWDAVDGGEGGGARAGGGGGGDGLLPFPAHLRDYVPTAWGARVGVGAGLYSALEQNIWAKGSALIALRDVWDEELFVDQTLNPFADAAGWVPEWARADWDARADMRRLAGRVTHETARAVRAAFFGAGEPPPRLP